TVCVVGKIRDLILQLSKSSIYSTKPDPFIVPAAFLNKLNILNANFDVLQLRAITGPQVKGCRFNRSINDYSYAGNFSDSIVTAATPNAINFTYARVLLNKSNFC
ncbi:hypothetical protein ACOS9K_29205, partial [Klebsiella pneumoniae]